MSVAIAFGIGLVVGIILVVGFTALMVYDRGEESEPKQMDDDQAWWWSIK